MIVLSAFLLDFSSKQKAAAIEQAAIELSD
jgi:hypothetical protein